MSNVERRKVNRRWQDEAESRVKVFSEYWFQKGVTAGITQAAGIVETFPCRVHGLGHKHKLQRVAKTLRRIAAERKA